MNIAGENGAAPAAADACDRGADSIVECLRTFIASIAPAGAVPGEIPADADLVDQGYIDSMGLLDLIGFMESEYRVKLDNSDLRGDTLDTLEHCALLIRAKLEAGGRG